MNVLSDFIIRVDEEYSTSVAKFAAPKETENKVKAKAVKKVKEEKAEKTVKKPVRTVKAKAVKKKTEK